MRFFYVWKDIYIDLMVIFSMYTVSILISGVIVGFVLYQSIIVAPLIFKLLDMKSARGLLRSIFPTLFKSLLMLGSLLASTGYWFDKNDLVVGVGLLTIILATICLFAIPATNTAADIGNQLKFKRLHLMSVLLTGCILLANLLWVVKA